MATKLHPESRRLYSWWWDSHISPKNSKWLQENLADTDMKVNTIIKLLEEDADSFARRAEMYYKKRPELMKLVEELYRAYRALAERYDHATGALRQAHRTMAEAFPNQIPLIPPDESPYGSSSNEAEPHTPEAPPPLRALFDPDDLQKDALGLSAELHVIKRGWAYSELSDPLSSKKGLKQLNEMFATGDGTACASEVRVRKGLNFQEEEGENLENKMLKWSREQKQVQEKQDASYVTKDIQQDISWLSAESQNLKNQIMAESDRANKAEKELQGMMETISKLMSENDAEHIQYQMSLERISVLESQLSTTINELNKLNDEMVSKVKKLQSTEELNQSLLLELEMQTKKANIQEHGLNQKQEELEKLKITIEDKHQQFMQAEMDLRLKEKLHVQYQEDVNNLSQEIEKGIKKLRDVEQCNLDLQEEIHQLKEENSCLHEQNLHFTLMMEELKDKTNLLLEKHRTLEDKVRFHLEEKEVLNQELCHIKEDRNDLEGKHQDLMEKMEAVSIHAESLEAAIKYLQNENSELKDICEKHEAEKVFILDNLICMDDVLEKNAMLENSLSDANVELEVLKGKILALEKLHESLNNEISTHISEKSAFFSQAESLTQDVDTLSNKNIFLENSLSDISMEVSSLRLKLKDFEESYELLSDQKSDLLAERDNLLSQIEILTQNMEKHSEKNSFLEKSLSDIDSEVGCLRSKLKDFEASYQSLSDQNSGLLAEKNTLLSQVEILTQNVEKLSDTNSFLENSLSDVCSEVEGLRSKLHDCEESCQSLSNQNNSLLTERNNLLSQFEILTQNVEKLSEKNSFLENSLSDSNNEVGCLRSKLKDSEESCQSLSDQISGLLAEKSTLISQMEDFTQNIKKLSHKNSILENYLSDVTNEVEGLRSRFKDFEESCQALNDQSSGLPDEKRSLLSRLEILTQNVEELLEKKTFLENSLSGSITEVGCLKSKLKDSEESISGLISERNALVSKIEVLTRDMEKLSHKNSLLESSLSNVNSEVGCFSSKLKILEESCQSLSIQNTGLLSERNTLLSQVEILILSVEEHSEKNSFLEKSLSDVSNEVGCLRAKLKDFSELAESLRDQNSSLIVEKNTLLSQLEILTQDVEKLSDKNSFLENSLADVSSEVGSLRSKLKDFEESCQSLSNQNCVLLAERKNLLSQLEILTPNVEKLLEKNSFLENSLSDISIEVRCLRSKSKDSEESCQSLSEQNSGLLAERNNLLSQVEVLIRNVEKLSDNNSFLESSLSDLSSVVGCLRSKLKDFEESCQLLSDQNSGLLSERNNLLSQMEILTQSVENLSQKNSFLENSLSDVSIESRCLRSKLKIFEESSQSLSDQNSSLIAERNNLLSQLEILTWDMEKLSDKNSLLENSLSDVSTEIGCLRSKMKDSEESCQSLNDQNSGLLAERNNLLTQVEVLTNDVEKLSDKNSFLVNSLSDVSSEAGRLRSKLKDIEESCQLLSEEKSELLSERNTILSQLEILTQNAEKLSDKNAFLENSLSAVSTEVGCLMSKLKDFEESCQSLRNQNSCLLNQRNTLVSQVESLTLNLENKENSFAELKDQNVKLSREKDLVIKQVKDLQDALKLEKEDHETLVRLCKRQLAALENQIFLLEEENQFKEEEFEAEQSNLIGALIENFILQRSLSDVNGRNSALSVECQKNLQACRSAEALISELEQEKLMHIKSIVSLSERNEKLSNGIRLLWDTLIVDKEFGYLDEIQNEVFLDKILGETKNMLNFISEAEHNNQLLHLEISVLVTLLKQTMQDLVSLRLEKCYCERELDLRAKELLALGDKKHELLGLNEKLMKDVEASNQREVQLKSEKKVLCGRLTDLQESLLTSKCCVLNLIEERKILMEELYNLRQEHNVLQEEHNEVLAETMKLDHLCLYFQTLSAERLLELKSFAYDLDSVHFIKNDLDAEIDKLKGKIRVLKAEKMYLSESINHLEEEFRNHLLLSEYDLITVTCVCEELNLQRQSVENQLTQKQSQLSETNQKVQSTQQENLELCRILEGLQLDNEAGKIVKDELEQKILNLSEVVAHRNDEVRCLYEANEMLQREIDQMHEEVKMLMSRQEDLISELQKEVDENERCEVEIKAILSDIQVSTVNAAFYEEKVYELILKDEVSALLQNEMLKTEVTLNKEYMDNLKKKLDELEGENRGLEADLDVYLSLVTSLWNGIMSLEEQIMTMSKLRPSNLHEKEDLSLVPHLYHHDSQPNGHKVMKVEGVPLLEKLITKVESLQKVMIDIRRPREHESFDASSNLGAASKEIQQLKTKQLVPQQDAQVCRNAIRHLDDDQRYDAETSKGKNGQMMKDIELDQDSSSLPYRTIGSYGLSRINTDEINDQLWEAAERNCSNRISKASTVAIEHDAEPVEEEKSEYPSSELMVEKELSVDKLEIPIRVLASQQEWAMRVLQRLETDARRLSGLETNVEDLKRKMESSQMAKLPANFGYDTIKAQLRDAEGAILELINMNNKLTTKAEEYHSSDGVGTKSEESSRKGRRQISEQARKESEKVGRLELDLHKIQYVLLKLEEENVNRNTNGSDRRTRILLRDYIYGRRDGRRQMKKSPFCGCMKPKTKGDQ